MNVITAIKKPTTFAGKYLLNVLISLDQLLGTLMFLDPDETISSYLGKLKRQPGGIPKRRIFSRVLAWILDKLEPNHCENAIEEDEGKDRLVDTNI